MKSLLLAVLFSFLGSAHVFAQEAEVPTAADLKRNLELVQSLDRVAVLSENTYGLYSGDKLQITLEMSAGKLSIKDSAVDFTPELVDFRMGQQSRIESFLFVFAGCETKAGASLSCYVVGAILNIEATGHASVQEAI